jgi:acyl-CoA reductase-like NAD-dependent aldehyde dehydrogenase
MTAMTKFDLYHSEHLYIGGKWVTPEHAAPLEVINPATEERVAQVAQAGIADIKRAVAAARAAFDRGDWSMAAPAERAARLRVVAGALRERLPDLARAITLEMGATLKLSTGSCAVPPMLFDFYADLVERLPEIEPRERPGGDAYSVMEPAGIVAAVVPWNAPLNLSALKVAPALAAGCSVILKVAPSTPLDALIFAQCLEAAGLPEGVVSVLPAGNEAADALVRDPDVDKVTFTGSTAVGRHIASVCGERVARVALELGGKSAAIILDDMPTEDVIAKLLPASTTLSGQACSALTRVIVPRHRHDDFVEAFAAALRSMTVGDPFDPATDMGPIAMARQRDRVEHYIAVGKAEGARLVAGGGRPAHLDRGYFLEPTLFDRVDNGMTIAREEIFGPVISVIPYEGEAEAIALANDSEYGLYGSIFSYDDEAVWRIGRRLRTGNVAKNAVIVDRTLPYGGFKQSGLGREGGLEGLRSFQEQKTVYLK